MRVVFFGTPDFAVTSLEHLNNSRHEVVAVVTAPDKERGRGRKISYTPVKQYTEDNNLQVFQPVDLKDEKFISELSEFNADVFVIVAFKILPESVFGIPEFGSFNLHGSLLPRYRGAAPIQWAIINGDEETGVTTFFLKEKVDTGDMILQRKVDIEVSDNLGSMYDKLKQIGAELVVNTINLIEDGSVKEVQQNESLASPAPKITKEMCQIEWNKPAADVHNLVRGLSPIPGAFFIYKNKRYKVYKTKMVNNKNINVGEISISDDRIVVGCKKSSLEVLELQPEGRKRLSAPEFLRGYEF